MNNTVLTHDGETICWRHSVNVFSSMVIAAWMMFYAAGATAANNPSGSISAADLSRMSLEELTNIEISSVSRHSEPLIDAAASVYVITREDIRRYGATNIPEILGCSHIGHRRD